MSEQQQRYVMLAALGGTPSRSRGRGKDGIKWLAAPRRGPMLVEAPPESLPLLRAMRPGCVLAPLSTYRLAHVERPVPRKKAKLADAAVSTGLIVKVVTGAAKRPVAGARVVAFTDFEARDGEQANTKANGRAVLPFAGGNVTLERLFVFPPPGFWHVEMRSMELVSGAEFTLEALDLTVPDALRHFYKTQELTAGEGVRIGVVDSGAATHPDLKVKGGACTVFGEDAKDFADGHPDGHGTHVCGIIAGRGTAPAGLRGLAPAAELHVFRATPKNSSNLDSFAIATGIEKAVAAGCDLINLSISFDGGPPDAAVQHQIATAWESGCAVIAASGNAGRQPVSFPASESRVLGVSAMGREGTFPDASPQRSGIAGPRGKDSANFVAAFSNIGADLDFTAPGVGVISSVPGGYAPMDGTSMACPAITGAAANLLSRNSKIVAMERTAARSEAIVKLLGSTARSLGFGPLFEGQGIVLL